MKNDELKDWLASRNYHVRQMENMNTKQLRRMVETFQIKEKAVKKMVQLNPYLIHSLINQISNQNQFFIATIISPLQNW